MKISLLLAAALIVGSSSAYAEPRRLDAEVIASEPIDNTTTTDEVAIGRDVGDRMTVAVSVGGNGPYRFLVDTGSERTVISRQLAERLNLVSGRDAVVHSVVGHNDVNTVLIPHLRVSNNVVSVIDAPLLEASNIGADGMLGIDSLRSQRVSFDFKAKTMSITPSKERLERYDGETIVVRARSRHGRLIFTEARIDGQKVTIIVDTGSQVTIGNMALQRRMIKKKMWTMPELITVEAITGEKLVAQVAKLQKLQLGGILLDDLAVVFADVHIFKKLELNDEPALLLGMNAMRAFDRISIDFESKKVRFVLPGTSMRQSIQMAAAGGT